jgi:hypothetical protein
MRIRFHSLPVKWRALLAMSLTLLTLQTAMPTVLTHRYSFDADASDSINGANGTLQGPAFITNGAVVLNGSNSFVRVPNDLFTNYTSASYEVWFTDAGINNFNALIYSFTGVNGAMNYQLFGGGTYRFHTTVKQVSLPSPAVGGTNHLVWVQDGDASTAAIYVNGALAGQNQNFSGSTFTPAIIGSTTNDYLGGNGSANTISNFNGSILEFRTYQGALTPKEVAVLDAFGPDQPQTDPGTLQAMRVAIPSPTGPGALFRAGVYADFSGVTNVNISTQPDLVLSSDNTNVIAFAADQRLQTVSLGTANITATWQGFSNTLTVTVGVPQDITLVHRYGFNEQTNDWIVHDSVANANGQVFNTGVNPVNAAFTGQGELVLAGGSGVQTRGYVALPPGIISSLSEVSIESWVTWTLGTSWPWQRIFDFGNNRSPVPSTVGVSYLFLTVGGGPTRFSISTNGINAETPHLDWTNYISLNVTSFVAVAYSPIRGIAKFYINGQPVSSGVATIPLSAIVDTNNWLGKSQFFGDGYLGGRYSEFRIYKGLLSDADVAADFAAGPDAVGVDYVLHEYSSSNTLAITWGPSATDLVLQSSPVLGAGAVWNQVTNAPILQNGRYGVTVPISADAAYFRLHTP